MARKSYKKLYLKEKETIDKLKNMVDYYKKCLEHMEEKGLITYTNRTVRSEYRFSRIEQTRIKVDDDFDWVCAVEIDEEDYTDWVKREEIK